MCQHVYEGRLPDLAMVAREIDKVSGEMIKATQPNRRQPVERQVQSWTIPGFRQMKINVDASWTASSW